MKSVNERSKKLDYAHDPESDGDLDSDGKKRCCSRLFVLKTLYFFGWALWNVMGSVRSNILCFPWFDTISNR